MPLFTIVYHSSIVYHCFTLSQRSDITDMDPDYNPSIKVTAEISAHKLLIYLNDLLWTQANGPKNNSGLGSFCVNP